MGDGGTAEVVMDVRGEKGPTADNATGPNGSPVRRSTYAACRRWFRSQCYRRETQRNLCLKFQCNTDPDDLIYRMWLSPISQPHRSVPNSGHSLSCYPISVPRVQLSLVPLERHGSALNKVDNQCRDTTKNHTRQRHQDPRKGRCHAKFPDVIEM